MKTRNIILSLIFIAIAIVELLGRLTDNIILEYASKPFIMIWIAIFFLLNAGKRSFRVIVLFAFFFSWVGDMFLMFSGGYDNELLFFAGVGGFFVSQVLYILVFLKSGENEKRGFLFVYPFWLIPMIAFLAGFYLFLYPSLEGVMRPVILVYAISLIGMSIAALDRNGRVGLQSFRWIFAGSLLFVLSDSMIAVNKFHFEDGFTNAGFWIMLTYILAQYMIMRGLILEEEKVRITG